MQTVRRHKSSDKGNTQYLWALAFGVHNRISFHELDDEKQNTCLAQDIPLPGTRHALLPSPNDWSCL